MDDQQPLPPLAALRAFHAAARTERFAQAAAELHVSQSAVSHHVRRLEDYLGVRLFERLPASVRLTDAGTRYFAEIHPALERIRQATGSLRHQGRRRRVTLTTLPSAANIWLIPNLGTLEAWHPDIDLQLLANTRLVDLDREQVDLALRFGSGGWSGVESRWLFAEQLIPVCAPGYLPHEAGPDDAAALRRARLIVNDTDPDEWTAWTAARGMAAPELESALRFAEGDQVLRAADNGLGLAMGRRPVVDPYLRAGSLVAPFGATERDDQACYLCYSPRREMPPHVAAVAEWLERLVTEIVPTDELLAEAYSVADSSAAHPDPRV